VDDREESVVVVVVVVEEDALRLCLCDNLLFTSFTNAFTDLTCIANELGDAGVRFRGLGVKSVLEGGPHSRRNHLLIPAQDPLYTLYTSACGQCVLCVAN